MKNVHIWKYEKFTEPYIEFVNKNFNSNEHLFFIIGINKENYPKVKLRRNVKYISNIKSYFKLILEMNKADKIILHGLFNVKIIRLLFLQPWLLKKSIWIVLGGDLYKYRNLKTSYHAKINEFVKKKVIKNFNEVATLVKKDYEYAKDWYKIKGVYKQARYIDPKKTEFLFNLKPKPKDENILRLQVGNSAAKSNNHMEAFNLIEQIHHKSILIYCPLSYAYGNKEYAAEVKRLGYEKFGSNFIPLEGFMSVEDYMIHLSHIDIGVFNSDRQQGLGNITPLLYLGKKVFIKRNTSMEDYFQNLGAIVHDIDTIPSLNLFDFEKVDREEALKNMKVVKNIYNEEKYIEIWKNIFI